MPIKTEKHSENGVISLVNGVIADVHMLVEQQLALFRHDVRSEFDQVQSAGTLLIIGLAVVLGGSLLLAEMLVQLLILMSVPIWVCYGMIGAPIAALGLCICLRGARGLNPSDPAQDPSPNGTTEAIDE